MDEAERCHRLAILDRGVLVADGTPQGLASELEGRTLAVHAKQPRRSRSVLIEQPGVLSVAQVGNTLRVLTQADDDAASRLGRALGNAGLEARVEAAEPNLEDVFVAATRGREEARERAA
jgi:ABC-2 type transport system ATP-binding protein